MALIKDLPDPFGTGTIRAYVRHAGLAVDPIARTIHATFYVYRDREAAGAGKDPVGQISFAVGPETTPSYDDLAGEQTAQAATIGALVYGFARAQPELAGAEDA